MVIEERYHGIAILGLDQALYLCPEAIRSFIFFINRSCNSEDPYMPLSEQPDGVLVAGSDHWPWVGGGQT
jgi:hypothetical protein